MTRRLTRYVAVLVTSGAALVAGQDAAVVPSGGAANVDWPVYRGDAKGNQYSPLAQIHAANVHRLERAWEYKTGDANQRSTMHANPVVVDGVMYITTPSLKAVALNAATGKEIWAFDPAKYNNGNVVRLRNRGVVYWKGTGGERIFHFVRDRVYAVDAKTGALITTFGTDGFIDLRQNLGVDPASAVIEMTSPGAVFKNMLIIASRVNESYDASPGHIRGYDTVSGTMKWIFHTIPKEGQVGHDTWKWVKGENYGGANAWGGVTIDEQRGWVFAATGSATDDFYGGFRKGDDLFANTVLALDAMTGERKWHFQTVRHDIWDYDNPPAPILVTIGSGPTAKDAVVQLTKMGFTFVLDRDTGKPLFPVQEIAVPRSGVPGEETSPTQLVPLKPQPLVRQNLTEADLTNITPEAHAQALKDFRRYLSGPIYTPPSLQGTITTPGHLGGAEWHGASFDPVLNMLYVNVNEVPTINRLRPVHGTPGTAANPVTLGRQIYDRTCAACHGASRQGTPPTIPALVDLKRTPKEIETVIAEGRNAMPAFRQFQPRELSALSAFLKTPPEQRREERSWRSASGPLHHRRLPVVPRSPWSAGYRAALGHVERHRSRQGGHRVEGPARRVPGARQEGHSQHRDAQLRRSRGDGRRHHRHCRDGRREDSRLREELWSSAVGTSASSWRLRHAEHLHDRRPAVHRHRGRRQRQERDEVRRLDHRLRAAAGPLADLAGRRERSRASR